MRNCGVRLRRTDFNNMRIYGSRAIVRVKTYFFCGSLPRIAVGRARPTLRIYGSRAIVRVKTYFFCGSFPRIACRGYPARACPTHSAELSEPRYCSGENESDLWFAPPNRCRACPTHSAELSEPQYCSGENESDLWFASPNRRRACPTESCVKMQIFYKNYLKS